jgi:hypothetical protein
MELTQFMLFKLELVAVEQLVIRLVQLRQLVLEQHLPNFKLDLNHL